MVRWIDVWRRVTAGKYTRALEAEVGRLRAENRALLNSILGIAGVPPIVVDAQSCVERGECAAVGPAASDACASGKQIAAANADGNSAARSMQVATPMRRRSWQQINRALEFESAKKANAGQASTAGGERAPGVNASHRVASD